MESVIPSYSTFLEESSKEDHDNDGINDLDDLDDDNDGIYDLLERFDGCYGTHPLITTVTGAKIQLKIGMMIMMASLTKMTCVQSAEDTDDDNNGILDVDQALLPGCFWGEEESPFDHDNDGIVDWADDGSGAGRYDEDDDNDGIPDQCRFAMMVRMAALMDFSMMMMTMMAFLMWMIPILTMLQ